ncbi:protein kinase domain-containing protein [Jiangella muralis]|uniref:protein kinase domain-containing protein n=1 Tax=Jiangella muralis TaxID=702383 RepID=UPI00069F1DA0|nr:protein kinase [Jiangella muralis]
MTTDPFAVTVPEGYRVGVWEVRQPLASGAFGSVYAARRVGDGPGDLPAEAALKFLPTGTRTPRQLRHLQDLIQREIDVLRRLRRPRLIRMYETLTVDDGARPELDGATVLVLERAQTSLDRLLAAGEPLDGGPAVLAQIAEGVAQLHRAGWVHGDLKPANVLVMADGSARLADFNLSAELEGTHAYGPLFASPDFAPPELLWAGVTERGQQVRPSADVWSFGVLAHLVLSGGYPFPGSTSAARRDAAVRYARGDDELRLSPALTEPWRRLIADCLAPGHDERSRHDAESVLRRAEDAAGAERSPRLPRLRPPRWRRRLGVAAVAAAVLGGGAIAWSVFTADEPASADPAEYGADVLSTDAGVPVEFRRLIVDSAGECDEPSVTPGLIAAMLKTESDFDADLSDPANDEYGIARWSGRVLYYWVTDAERPNGGDPQPPFPPETSIPALGRYLCFVAPRVSADLPGGHQVNMALAHRSSDERVNEWAGSPPEHLRVYADSIARYLDVYTPDAG